ncbi:hypothetical protein [Fibrobacter sp. UWH1]|uniref:hypothetical protein n=1 Tax=Fibrobacter sp. UWH1 TaxID=1964354 RepID=UPI000B71FECA|nr:hypothetical protein [Fibrobacter sp. UWH1]OWV15558.1 hypothetical protein B7992_04020 [Fibrobacter sp. UWH1]
MESSGCEFWYARELQSALEYKEWRNFEKSVDKAKLAEKANETHFVVGQVGGKSFVLPNERLILTCCIDIG